MSIATTGPNERIDEPEGGDDASVPEYPLKEVLIRTEPRTIQDVLRRIEANDIVLDPDYQRAFVWKPERQSRLIESVLVRIPLPVFYLAEDDDGRLIAVDGRQRLTTLREFHLDKLKLELANQELNGRTFSTLDPKLKKRFLDGQLLFYIIDAKVNEAVRLDIFDRVNSGVALTGQQVRNAIYNGPATRLLGQLAANPDFLAALPAAFSSQDAKETQRDREVVNRFIAFEVLTWSAYGTAPLDDMKAFLGAALRKVNKLPTESIKVVEKSFANGMANNIAVFARLAFRRHTSTTETHARFNIALFEVFAVLFAPYPQTLMQQHASEIREESYKLMGDPKFISCLSARTTDASSIKYKFEAVTAMLKGVLGDPQS